LQILGREGVDLSRLERIALEEIAALAAEGPTAEEVERAKAMSEARLISGLEAIASKADQLNAYYYYTGEPDHVAEDLAAIRALTAAGIRQAAREYLDGQNRLVLSIVPEGRTELAAKEGAR